MSCLAFLSFSLRPHVCPLHPIVLGPVNSESQISLEVFGAREARRFYRRGFFDPLSHDQWSSENTVPFSRTHEPRREVGATIAGSVGLGSTGLIYRSLDHSLGAAHVVAQWARWKTVYCQHGQASFWCGASRPLLSKSEDQADQLGIVLTLLDTVLLGTSVRLLRGDALDTLIVVVLGWGALLGLLALCRKSLRQPPFCASS